MARRQRRERDEEFLHADEQELADFFDHAAMGLHWMGPDGHILKVNQAELDLLGYSREEYVGHHISEFHADPEVIADILQRLARNETLRNYEARLRCKDGSIKHVLITSNVRWKDGQFVHTRCCTHDITEWKRVVDTLRTNEERYRLAIRASHDVIWDWDMGTDEAVCGEALSELFGYPMDQTPRPREMVYRWWKARLHPEDVERVCASYEAFLQSAADTWSAEYRFQRADGSYATVFDRAFMVRSATGTPVRIVGAMTDITARKEAEEAPRVRQRAAVAALGQRALQGIDLAVLMREATAMLAQALDVEYCKVSELLPGGNGLLLRAGVGWKDGYVGHAMIPAGGESQAGYTLLCQTPVIVEDLRTETRFQGSPLLLEHDVVSGMSVIVHGQDRPFGVLSAHTTRRRTFTPDDMHFLQAIANVLGEAISHQRMEEVLWQSEVQYRLLFEGNPHPMWVFDRETLTFLAVNEAAASHFGYFRQEFLGMSLKDIHSPEDVPCLLGLIEALARATREPWSIDLAGVWKLRKKDGTLLDVELTWSPIHFGGRAAELVLAHDITERKKAEENLLRRTQELEAMVSIANALAGPEPFEVKAEKMLVTMNTLGASDIAILRLPTEEEPGLRAVADSGPGRLGVKPGVLVHHGHSMSSVAHERGEPVVANDYAASPHAHPAVVAQGVKSAASFPLRVGGVSLGVVGLVAGEKELFTPERVQLLAAVAGELGVLVDNARLHEETGRRLEELHTAHERLQTLSQRLLEVQEMERRHIARELHDEIGQHLTATQLLLDMADQAPAEEMGQSLHKVRALVHELMERVRDLSLDLRPPMLDDFGLLPTLLWHFKRYTAQSNIVVDFKHAGLEGRRFRSEIETAAFRTVQEGLTNVARHAKVKHAAVRVWTTGDTLGVQVEDQGVGFDAPTPSLSRMGLSGMCERVQLLSGTLTIEAEPGGGTRITAEWPLADHDRKGGHERDHHPGGGS